MTVFVGRQPIFDQLLNLHGYELLFRPDGEAEQAVFVDGDAATSQVLLSAFVEIGLDNLVRDRLAYVNLTRSFFLEGLARQLPRERVVLELLEDIAVDDALLDALEALSRDGYRIALDDFVYRSELEPLLELASVVKLDLTRGGREAFLETVRAVSGRGLTLLAEKVETEQDFAFCRQLGVELFQGFFFARPAVVEGPRAALCPQQLLRTLVRLQHPHPQNARDGLETALRDDRALAQRLLPVLTEASQQPLRSIREAALLLGEERVRAWATLVLLASAGDKPHELALTAMIRAQTCADLARDPRQRQRLFFAGLISTLDALLDRPLEGVVAALPLSQEERSALLRQEGSLGAALAGVLAYERWDWDRAADSARLGRAYLRAVRWANQMFGNLSALSALPPR